MNDHRPPVLFLVGPTAVGKSDVAVDLAKRLGGEIVNADSRQVFCGMDIGTGKLTPDEQRGVPHHLIDIVTPDEPFSVGQYRRLALERIARIHANGRVPLVVGGTGLYVKALAYGLWDGPPANWEYRKSLMHAERCDAGAIHRLLMTRDPVAAERIHPHDHVKMIRALEVFRTCRTPMSMLQECHGFRERRFHAVIVGLSLERRALYRRIESRVDRQIQQGLVDEVQRLLANRYDPDLQAMKGLGYRQLIGYVRGIESFDESVRKLKRDTRRYAKRQETWFRKDSNIFWMPVEERETSRSIADRIIRQVGSRFADVGNLVV